MQIIFLRRLFYVCLLLLMASGSLRAQFEEGQSSGTMNHLPCTGPLPSSPDKVFYTPLGATSRKIRNIVRFKIDESAPGGTSGTFLYFKSGFTATVSLKVEMWTLFPTGSQTPDVTNSNLTLTVNYDPATGVKYNPTSYVLLDATAGYEQVQVTINSVTVTGLSNGWTTADVLPLLFVDNEISYLRYYSTPVLAAPVSFSQNYDDVNHPDQLSVGWSFPAGNNHNMAQLEYAWVENETKAFYNVAGVFDPNALFMSNSSRIDIDIASNNAYNYSVPLLYPANPLSGGTLYYRVRAALKRNDGNLITGPWSTAQPYPYAGHQPNMNWQVSTVFAENAKSKTVIQYFDGSLRPRQTVTKDNSTGNTTVAETIYDLQGRPNVQILPTPTLSTAIQYFKDFNRFEGQSTNDNPAKYFDLAVAGNQCVGAPALKKDRGNGQYYSPNNPWIASEATAKLVPDANGYAYSETRYTDDPTGRITSQGGVGQSHQTGSGHETKYFYGKPTQNELDALFGTEAGDATHYFKNMMQDANGQMSVSYVDMHGRTVATALAGDAPGKLSAINNNGTFYPAASGMLTSNLLTPTSNIIKDNSIESISTLLLPTSTHYYFTYQLTPAILQQMSCNNQSICFDCKYDLEISIRPEGCSNAAPIVKHYNNLQMVAAGQACGSSMGFTGDNIGTATTQIQFDTTLGVGSWIVRKTLTLNDSLLKIREDSALKVFLCKTQQDIEDSIFSALSASTNCGVPRATRNCSACQAQLGDYATYKSNYISSVGGSTSLSDSALHALYAQDSLACSEACGLSVNPAFSTLGMIRARMLADMIPYTGQYALPSADATSLSSRYNIFATASNYGNIRTRPYFRNPVSEPNGDPNYYVNTDGTADIMLYPNGQADHATINALAASDFAVMFKRNWADRLIYFHPEYSKLHYAETTMASSYNWLDNVMHCNTYADALAKGYLNPVSSDPYFTYNSNHGYVQTDRDSMLYYLSVSVNPNESGNHTIWRIANGVALVDTTLPQALQFNFMAGMNKDGIDPSAVTDAQKNAVWLAFRNQYLSYRNDMVVKYVNAQMFGSLSETQMNQLRDVDHKTLYFFSMQDNATQNGWTWWGQAANKGGVDPVSLATQATANAAPYLLDQCAGQRPFWQGRLMQCEQLQQFLLTETHSDSVKVTNIINTILDSMVMVCHNSINGNNPEGASNVNPALRPLNPDNFEAIINHVFTANGIATLPGDNYFCNPYSVDYPKPFNANPPLYVKQAAYADTCNCSQFAMLKAAAKAAGYDSTSLSSMNAYLLANYGDSLTLPLWQGLASCNGFTFWTTGCVPRSGGGDSCFTYYRRIPIGAQVVVPAFLNCGYVRPCVTCTVLKNYTDTFRLLYPAYSAVPYVGETDANMVRQNELWARYLNYKTGFNKSANEYAAVYPSCFYANGAPAWLLLTDRATQPPSGSPPPQLYIARDSIIFFQEYSSLNTDEFETLLSGNGGAGEYALCDFSKPVTSFPLPDTTDANPCQQAKDEAKFIGMLIFQQRKDSLIGNFDSLYKAKCFSAQSAEVFYATYQPSEYHYTLYYYDQAGNLVKTLPPAAVRPNFNATYLAQVQSSRLAATDLSNGTNIENMATQYRYNSLNQVVAQRSPDAGIANFWYDRLGRLAVSQNAKQLADPSYSYTIYDQLGRIKEVGQKPQSTGMTQTISQDETALSNWLADLTSGGTKAQVTRTVYDVPYVGFSGLAPLGQVNLRNRVAYTQVFDAENLAYRAATYYSYDVHGNVDTLVQDYGASSVMTPNGNQYKLIKYDYDLVSNKVNQVSYQPGRIDAFYHQYTYDAENRITGVRTSRDSIQWENDATYQYYRHGPLARATLGGLQVQGIDYAYTLQGWLKSVNPSWVDGGGGDLYDSDGTGVNSPFARDAFKFNLHYFDDGVYTDYKPVSAPVGYVQGNTLPLASRNNLYNGNINSMAVNIRKLTTSTPMIYNYKYDQLNRISSMDAWAANGSFGPTGTAPMQDYAERYGYDPNGNILTLSRNGFGSNLAMDNMSYKYQYVKGDGTIGEYTPGQAVSGSVDHMTNRLSSIGDIASTGYDDIKSQAPLHYQYDQIGNLINDSSSTITWNVYGKILTITNASGVITYTYDASGNRISKNVGGITTWYVRDASGNVMATYVQGDNAKNSGALTQTEAHVYGSSRLGILNLNVNCTNLAAPTANVWVRGSKLFELSNHLGNVLVTVTDKKIQNSAGLSVVDYYSADVASATDYYPFGMQMPGRTFSSGGYRYGFNGKENDNEVKGIGDQIDYGMRVYDPRVGKFLSVDALTRQYPELTPYQYTGNNPIAGVDLDGNEFIFWYLSEKAEKYLYGTTHLRGVREGFLEQAEKNVDQIVHSVKSLINTKYRGPIYGVNTTYIAGIPPGAKPEINPELASAAEAVKKTLDEYQDLVKKAANGDNKAVGALAFEAGILFFPGGEEAKAASMIPRGFKNAEQFAKVGEELAAALDKSGINYEKMGVTGSSVTGVSSKGGGFRQVATGGLKASDIDVFVILREDIPVSGGKARPEFIHPDKMINAYPALREWSEKWSKILQREITPAAIKPKPKK
ncbi:RHS repeat-associated core domain-containing protein [Flavitalea sp. BT771]|uniref:RHS repeat-associated core domain-containing protein n=1 Tax=Flavitalea sp. BT771 TaxID=3063329 RepID=UPI0026E39B2B|nr:RHS repeat-associated core domain-containing protein [Flavitalea sp. BT771]MDO6433979.1 RHS repeat-associated core domain-containing protein [Flavitalea sp. BT771]MDV6222879.1 RHS repeat-associated core domain-containing protein [Flavitalea sp. BT771]